MIPFSKDFAFEYGVAHNVSPLIRRVVARNPGRFTGPGTGTLIVGRGRVAVVDPGPDCDDHFDALQLALKGEAVTHVFATHQHIDHSPLGRRLATHFGALLCGRQGLSTDEHGGHVREEASDDVWFRPDIELTDGWLASGDGWTIRALHLPGHTSSHFCFHVPEVNGLLCGDHLMAWSTSIISPPDGHMGDYLKSLARIRAANFARLIPTHGTVIEEPAAFIESYFKHRYAREAAILNCVMQGTTRIASIVADLYAEVDRGLHPAAMHSVWAHLIHLVEQGYIEADPSPSICASYYPRANLSLAPRTAMSGLWDFPI